MLRGLKTYLRPLEDSDLNSLYQWYNDQEVNYWANASWPLATMLSKEALADRMLEPGTMGAGLQDSYRLAILDRTEKLIGYTGYHQFNIPARSATVFITIGDKAYWSQGYGSDALTTLAKFLFGQWNFHRLQLDTWDGNLRALKAYQKVGFQVEGRLRQARFVLGHYHDAILLGLLQPDFFIAHSDLGSDHPWEGNSGI